MIELSRMGFFGLVRATCRSSLLPLLLVLPANAQIHMNQDAVRVASYVTNLDMLTRYTWTVTGSNENSESVVHLLQGSREVATSHSPGSPNTTLRFFSLFGGQSRLLVRGIGGNGNVTVTEKKSRFGLLGSGLSTVIADSPVGGEMLQVEMGNLEYQTALILGGISDPVLYGFDSDEPIGRIVASDDNSGVGANAKLSHPNINYLLLTSHHPPDNCLQTSSPCDLPKKANVYENDVHNDTDGDGLGDKLEDALQTCTGNEMIPCTVAQNVIVGNTRDTDGDGIADGEEVFGVDHSDFPQHLPKWGADPRHKDVFVEVDYQQSTGPVFMPTQRFARIRASYRNGSGTWLENPDGAAGVNLHLDVGFNPSADQLLSNPAFSTLFGDWGGSDGVPDAMSLENARDNHLDSARQRIFHYALQVRRGSNFNGNNFSYSRGKWRLFSHELGHTLGVDHFGQPAAGEMNCKPHYVSIMNYMYDSESLGNWFSDGRRDMVLNPASVVERQGIGVVDLNFFGHPGITHIKNATTGGVDWDFSGIIETEAVRAPVTFVGGNNVCGTSWKNAQALYTAPALPAASPALIRSDSHLFAFWIRPDFDIGFASSLIGSADGKGSCPLTDKLMRECTIWSQPTTLPAIEKVTSVDAVLFKSHIVLLYRTINEAMGLAILVPDKGVIQSIDTFEVSAKTAVEPEIAKVYYRNQAGGVSVGVGIYYLDDMQNYQWMLLEGLSAETLKAKGLLLSQNADSEPSPITGKYAPSVVAWPDTSLDTVSGNRNCLAAPTATQIEVFCDLGLEGQYQLQETLGLRVHSKTSLVYRLHRKVDGSPLDITNRAGNFWLAYNKPHISGNELRTRVWISRPFDGNGAVRFTDVDSSGDTVPTWDFDFGARQKIVRGSGVTLFMDLNTSALKALAIQPSGGLDTRNDLGEVKIGQKASVTFLPFADGTFNADLKDANDWKIMKDGICEAISSDGSCDNL